MQTATKITKGSRRKPKVMEIPADDIRIDPNVQRDLIPARVKRLADKMDLDGLGILTVSDRGKGGYVAIDGQHRIAALKALEMGEWEVTCHVYAGLSTAQEAALFRRLNDTRKITAFDDYDKGLKEGDDEILAINKIIEKHDLKVRTQGVDGSITCVVKIRQIFAKSPQLLDDTLELTHAIWGTRYAAVEKNILGGLAIIIDTYAGNYDRPTMIKKLAKYKGGPAGMIGSAKQLRELRGTSQERAVAEVIVATYNRGRRTGLLEQL